jgi:3D-(3,5/4)-trihydroxycyclohexane-1,2-dione acylhydrolase (decyclizing)
MNTIHLTAAQALVRYLTNQFVRLDDGSEQPLFAGVWAIFGHGNVAGIGEALYQVKDQLPTYRGHIFNWAWRNQYGYGCCRCSR